MSNVTFIRTLTDDLNQNLLVLIGRLYIVAELSTSIVSTLSSPCLNLLTLALAFSISLTVGNRRKQADAVVENNNKWTQAPSVCVSGKHLRFNHDCPSYVKVRHCINKPISIRASCWERAGNGARNAVSGGTGTTASIKMYRFCFCQTCCMSWYEV